MIRCYIVDDEPAARDLLREFAEDQDELDVEGCFGDPVEALEAINQDPPDILFLDVEMPRLTGFELLSSLEGDRLPVVVFTTAYDEYAVGAFEVSAVDYLLKPFHEERFEEAVRRAIAAVEARRANRTSESADPNDRALRRLIGEVARTDTRRVGRIAVKAGHRIKLLPTEQIDYIEAEGNYVRVHVGDESYLLRDSMTAMEEKLDSERFARVHRKHIVNVGRVSELEPLFKGEYVLVLRGGRRVTTGRTYRDRVREIFDLEA